MIELKIITPDKTTTHTIAWIELNTRVGNFIVQPGHTPMIVTLAPNKETTYCLNNGKQESFLPAGGIAEITRTSATLLLTSNPE